MLGGALEKKMAAGLGGGRGGREGEAGPAALGQGGRGDFFLCVPFPRE